MVLRASLHLYRRAFSGLPREVWLLALVAIVNRSGTMVLPFLSLYLTRGVGLGVSRAGSVLALYGVGSVIGSWVGGRLSELLGSVRAQQLSLALGGAGLLWLGTLDDPTMIALAVVPVSVAMEAFRPANMAAIAERAPAAVQLRSLALLRLAINLGMAVGPAVGGFLALGNYLWLFAVDAATAWAAAVLLALVLTPWPAGKGAPLRPAGPSPWMDRPFLWLMFVVLLLAMAFFQITSTLPLYLREAFSMREDEIGLLLGLNAVMIVLFEMVLVHWAERRARLPLAGAGSFLVCLGFAMMPFGTSMAWAAVTVLVWTAGEMLSLPLLNAVVTERAGAHRVGAYVGLYTMVFSAALVLAPISGAFVYERFGPRTLWLGIGALGPLLWAALVALRGGFLQPVSDAQPERREACDGPPNSCREVVD